MTLLKTAPLVNDTVDALLGLALIGGLFFAYYIQRRNKRLAREAPERVAVLPPEVVVPSGPSGPSGPSPSFAASLAYTIVLVAAATHPHSFWGYFWQALFGVMLVFSLVTTFARGDYEASRTKAPALSRREHMLMNGIPYVLLPLVGWVLVIPFGWIWGAIVPGVIWLVPFGLGIAVEAYEALRGPRR